MKQFKIKYVNIHGEHNHHFILAESITHAIFAFTREEFKGDGFRFQYDDSVILSVQIWGMHT